MGCSHATPTLASSTSSTFDAKQPDNYEFVHYLNVEYKRYKHELRGIYTDIDPSCFAESILGDSDFDNAGGWEFPAVPRSVPVVGEKFGVPEISPYPNLTAKNRL